MFIHAYIAAQYKYECKDIHKDITANTYITALAFQRIAQHTVHYLQNMHTKHRLHTITYMHDICFVYTDVIRHIHIHVLVHKPLYAYIYIYTVYIYIYT